MNICFSSSIPFLPSNAAMSPRGRSSTEENQIQLKKMAFSGEWKKIVIAMKKVLGHEVELNWSALGSKSCDVKF